MVRAETIASTVVHSTVLDPARPKTTAQDVVDSLRFPGTTIEPRVPVDALATKHGIDELVLVFRRKFQQPSTVVVGAVTIKTGIIPAQAVIPRA